MADEPQLIRGFDWRNTFPFTLIFKSFRVAIHPSKLVLALMALLLLYFGGRIMDLLWIDRYKPVGIAEIVNVPGGLLVEMAQAVPPEQRQGIFITFFQYEIMQVNATFAHLLQLDLHGAANAIWGFLAVGPAWLFTHHWLFAILFTTWFLLIWSIFGGAISRIAAVHVARDEKISLRQALRFSVAKFLSFLSAPIIPLLIVLVIGLVLAVGGLLFYIPWVGPILGSLLFFLALIAGFVATLVLIGTIGGFNMMYPTVAVEGSDSFDAISRSFSYVFARPWRMLWYTLVALVYGAITYLFVRFFIFLVLAVTHGFVNWWLSGTTAARFEHMWPAPDWRSLPYLVGYQALPWDWSFAGGMTSLWVYLVIGMLGAYAISFYFSANTIIYYLMRHEVDATELDDVYLEQTEDDFGDTTSTVVTPSSATAASESTTPPSPAMSSDPTANPPVATEPGTEPRPAGDPIAPPEGESPDAGISPDEPRDNR
jgi:hypothetical protein